MKFQSISLIAGTRACNASCPFCVSKMTGQVEAVPVEINSLRLQKAFKLCEMGDVTTAIITGKGEPLLFPKHISEYVNKIYEGPQFPFVELQTNGRLLEELAGCLSVWSGRGLTTVMISNVGYDEVLNRKIFFGGSECISFEKMVEIIHNAGLIVRFTTIGIRDGIDSPDKIIELVDWAKSLGVEQISWRPVSSPNNSEDPNIIEWVKRHQLDDRQVEDCCIFVREEGTQLYSLVHGAAVYDLFGQNFCLTNCLTNSSDEETVRQLIFFPNGRLYTDWQYKGSILL